MITMDRLERKFGKYVPENLTKILLAGQVVSFIIAFTRPDLANFFYLTGAQLYSGELWKLALVLFTPFSGSLLFTALAWYFFYYYSTELEARWGSFRYLLYVLIAYAAAVFFALVFPFTVVSNVYIYITLFLAFTHLYPRVRVLLFFIIPIEVKWLGYFAWLGLLISFLTGSLADKVLILLSITNFLIFFYGDFILFFKHPSVPRGTIGRIVKEKPLHICAVCSDNEIKNPYMEIRYCSICQPATCYCGEHISRHQHKRIIN